jgi:hypothetical protein
MKRCTNKKCLQWKPESEFHKNKRTKDGLACWCKSCLNKSAYGWIKDNLDKFNKQRSEWTKKDRTRNPERYRTKNRKYYASDLEKSRKSRRIRHQKWKDANPEKVAQNSRNRRALENNAVGKFTVEQWTALKKKYSFMCLRCGQREPEIKLTPDHVLPLSRGGSNEIENIQPLCLMCNVSKGAKHIDYRPDKGGAIAKHKQLKMSAF